MRDLADVYAAEFEREFDRLRYVLGVRIADVAAYRRNRGIVSAEAD
jgi:hypothetical protein